MNPEPGLELLRRPGRDGTLSSIWTARVWCRGREVWRSTGLRNYEAALAWARRLRDEVELAAAGVVTHNATREVPLGDLVDEWERELERRGRDADHYRLSASRVRELLRGVDELDALTPERISRELARVTLSRTVTARTKKSKTAIARAAEPLSPRTQNAYLLALRGWFGWLVRSQRWATNPAAAVAAVEIGSAEATYERRPLSLDEARRLLAVAPLERRGCYVLAIITGLRRDELAALTWAAVDFEAATLRVRASRAKDRLPELLHLPAEVLAVLQQLRAARVAGLKGPRGRRLKGWQEGDQLVAPPSVRTLQRDLEAAGVDHVDHGRGCVDFHSLRGTLSTGLKDLGVSLASRQAAMRHSDPKLTAGSYTGLHEGELAGHLDLLGDALAPALVVDSPPNADAPADAPVPPSATAAAGSARKRSKSSSGNGSEQSKRVKSRQGKAPTSDQRKAV